MDSVRVVGTVMAYAYAYARSMKKMVKSAKLSCLLNHFPAILYYPAVSVGSNVGVARILLEDLVNGSEVKQQMDTANPAGFGKTIRVSPSRFPTQ